MATKTILKIHPMSVAKYATVLYALIGLVIGIIGAAFPGEEPVSALQRIGILIGAPILYGIMGFLGGLIASALYNAIVQKTGGIKIDLK